MQQNKTPRLLKLPCKWLRAIIYEKQIIIDLIVISCTFVLGWTISGYRNIGGVCAT